MVLQHLQPKHEHNIEEPRRYMSQHQWCSPLLQLWLRSTCVVDERKWLGATAATGGPSTSPAIHAADEVPLLLCDAAILYGIVIPAYKSGQIQLNSSKAWTMLPMLCGGRPYDHAASISSLLPADTCKCKHNVCHDNEIECLAVS